MRATYLLLAILFAQVFCDTVYLSANTGSDDGEGTEENPFQTFNKAFNSTDGTASLEIYLYPGVYGGVNNTGLTYAGALTINWYQNSTAVAGDASAAQIDCTSAVTTSGAPCLASETSITISGLDDNGLPQISFSYCGVCLSLNKTAEDKDSDYVLDITGVSFTGVTQYAISATDIYSVSISNSTFSDTGGDGLSLVHLINVEDDILIENSQFNSLNKNSLFIVNTTLTELDNNSFTDAKIYIQGVDQSDSQVIVDTNVFVDSGVTYTLTLTNGVFTIKNSKFNSQSGALDVSFSDTTSIINTSFEAGAQVEGGAAKFENVTTVTISENSFFSGNAATTFGGAIYSANSTVHIDATNFTFNAAIDGAAVGCLNGTNIYYDNTTVIFSSNTNTDPKGTDIQNTCVIHIQSFQSSLVVSSLN